MDQSISRQDDQSSPLLGSAWLWSLLVLLLAGLGASIYLSVLHWRVHHLTDYQSFCAISTKWNCDTVAVSPYSVLLGTPVSTWGILFYSWMIVLGIWGLVRNRKAFPWGLLALGNALALGLSSFLFWIGSLVIGSFCILCGSLYLVNLASWLVILFGQQRAGVGVFISMGLGFAGFLLGGLVFGLWFYKIAVSSTGWIATSAVLVLALLILASSGGFRQVSGWWESFCHNLEQLFLKPIASVSIFLFLLLGAAGAFFSAPFLYADAWHVPLKGLAHGHTPDGHNWIGAEKPLVTILEYSDYECPFCRGAHQVVRELVKEKKAWLRLVHVHVPLDQSCNPNIKFPLHKNACACARAAICADLQGHFWEMNDSLYQRRCKLSFEELVSLGIQLQLDDEAFKECLGSEKTMQVLLADIAECRSLEGECREMGKRFGTPTFVMEDQVIVGFKSKAWWEQATESVYHQKKTTLKNVP